MALNDCPQSQSTVKFIVSEFILKDFKMLLNVHCEEKEESVDSCDHLDENEPMSNEKKVVENVDNIQILVKGRFIRIWKNSYNRLIDFLDVYKVNVSHSWYHCEDDTGG